LSGLSNLDLGTTDEMQSHRATKADLQHVQTQSATVTVTDPPSQDFSFVERLQLFVRSGDVEEAVADLDDVAGLGLSAPNPRVSLTVNRSELVGYAQAYAMTFALRGKGSLPPVDTRLAVEVQLEVQANSF
jgi:hypothetical protein